jgi:hypothetical protein
VPDRHISFAHEQIAPAYWANALQDLQGGAFWGYRITKLSNLNIRVPGGAGPLTSALKIQGFTRFATANVDRAHPGGAAGLYDVFAVAAADAVVNTPVPFTDNTNYAHDLRIVATGNTPTLSAGVVDIYRKVGQVTWDGAAITGVYELLYPDAIPRVTALHPSPWDGLTVDFVADSTKGTLWRLRYNAGSGSLYKWECIGGTPLTAIEAVNSNGIPASASWVDVTNNPQLTIPLAGDYLLGFYSEISVTAANTIGAALKVGTTAVNNIDGALTNAVTGLMNFSRTAIPRTVSAATMIVKMQHYAAAGASAGTDARGISAMPVRCG